MVDLVGDQSGNAALIDRDLRLPVDVLVFDMDDERPGHHAADVEKTEAALVLLISLR